MRRRILALVSLSAGFVGVGCVVHPSPHVSPVISPRLRAVQGSLAPYATRLGIVVVRDANGRPIGYRVFTPDR